MRNPETMLRVYEELADRFVAQNEPRFRDHCLVLAADAALAADRPQDAERVRQQLLQHNPHHLLRPFASMSEAMQAPDVQEYVADLRRQWPPEFVQKLYLDGGEARGPAEPATSAPLLPRTEYAAKDVTTAAPPLQAKQVDVPPPRRPVVAAPVAVAPPASAAPPEP